MIVHCPDCSSKYEIAAAKIPEGGIRVRCPRCKAVFPIRAVGEDAPPVFAAAPPRSANGRDGRAGAGPAPAGDAPRPRPAAGDPPRPSDPVSPAPRSPAAGPPRNTAGAPAWRDEPPAPPRKPRPVTDPVVARRMARAMVHEIVLPRRTEHETSLREGTVLSRFGPDLARALGLYEERVSPDLPDRGDLFRGAVNDILGGGNRLL